MTFTNIGNKLPSHEFIVCKEMDSIGLKTTRTKYLWNLLKIPQRNFSRLAAGKKSGTEGKTSKKKLLKKIPKVLYFYGREMATYINMYKKHVCVFGRSIKFHLE